MSNCNSCNGTGKISQVISGQREFGGDASSYSEQPCPECNPQVCPNCKDIIEQLQADLKQKTEALEKLGSKLFYASCDCYVLYIESILPLPEPPLKENGK